MEMPNLWIATKCYKVYRNLVALFTKRYGIQKEKQRNVTNDLQTYLATYSSKCFGTVR